MFTRSAWLLAGVLGLLTLLGVLIRLVPRWQAEQAHRQLAVILDYQQLYTRAQDEGFPIDDWLDELKLAGFDHLALSEDNPLWLEQRGYCTVVEGYLVTKSVPQKDLHKEGFQPLLTPEQQKAQKAKAKPEFSFIPEDKLAAQFLQLSHGDLHLLFPQEPGGGNLTAVLVARAAEMRLGAARVTIEDRPVDGVVVVSLRGDVEDLVKLGLGYVTPTYRELKGRGFALVPRLRNQRGLPVTTHVQAILQEAWKVQSPGPGLLIFEGDEVLGFPKAMPEMVEALQAQPWLFGFVEFAKQTGDKSMADQMVPHVVRVHSISDEEMEIYTPERALRRYLLAATERNVRAIYLKPFHMELQGVSLRQFNTEYFGRVRTALEGAGFAISSIDNGTIRNGLGPWPVKDFVPPPSSLQNLAALLVAFFAPLLAVSLLATRLPAFLERADRGDGFGAGAMALFWIWGWGLAAALLVAALLSEAHYMLQTRSFSGVTLALLGPVALSAVLWVRILVANPPVRIWEQAVLLGDFPVHVKHLAAGGFVLLAAMIIVLRSGNEPVGGVSPIELAFRAFLGDLLDVRPRTKEFLIGHPALVLGCYLLFQPRRSLRPWAFPLLVLGLLGTTSFINTFQHLHTPLSISLARTFLAMGMGVVLGGLGALVIHLAARWLLPEDAPESGDTAMQAP